MQERGALLRESAGKVVFDLRGSKTADSVLQPMLPVRRESLAPSRTMRVHSGYANDANSGSGGYSSYWETHDGLRLPAAARNAVQAVFLVNHETTIPEIALAMQASGEGSILSEDAIDDTQVALSRPFLVFGRLYAMVRTSVLSWPDGTTGLSANAVLNQSGDTAFKSAVEWASDRDPGPGKRPKLTLPPARFIEKPYYDHPWPNTEYRMVSAARIWGVFFYFHPYRHLYGEDWTALLPLMLAKMSGTETARDYHLAVAEMVAHVHDTHCFVSSAELSGFYGSAAPPVELRWIEEQPVVTRVLNQITEVRPGDVLTKIDGEPWQKRAGDLKEHISASTPQSMMNRVMGTLLAGANQSTVRLTLKQGDQPEREVSLQRGRQNFSPFRTGKPFRLLNPKIGYVDLEKLTNAQVDAMFDSFRDTEAIVMDMRGYPQGTAWSVAPRLAQQPEVVAASFRRNLVRPDNNAGLDSMSLTFEQRIPATNKPRYAGKTVMLIDERAISQSEHSGLFYRGANGTKFIDSPTTGANGDVTFFTAPGGIRINFSGHDVRWPDGKQLQRVGLTPDIDVRPTIAGIAAGRDEVLDRAVTYLQTGR